MEKSASKDVPPPQKETSIVKIADTIMFDIKFIEEFCSIQAIKELASYTRSKVQEKMRNL